MKMKVTKPGCQQTFRLGRRIEHGQQFDGRLLEQPDDRLVQRVLVLVQPAGDAVVHRASVVDQGEVGLALAFARLGLLKGLVLAQVLVNQLVSEAFVCSLREHALLFKDGEDTQGLWKGDKKEKSTQT